MDAVFRALAVVVLAGYSRLPMVRVADYLKLVEGSNLPRRPGEDMACERQPEEVTFEAPPIVGLL